MMIVIYLYFMKHKPDSSKWNILASSSTMMSTMSNMKSRSTRYSMSTGGNMKSMKPRDNRGTRYYWKSMSDMNSMKQMNSMKPMNYLNDRIARCTMKSRHAR